MNFLKNKKLSRRVMLRNSMGSCFSVPILDIMLNNHGTAFANDSLLPRRFFNFFNTNHMFQGNNTERNAFFPNSDASGNFASFPAAFAALNNYQGLKEYTSFISNLQIPHTTLNSQGVAANSAGWFPPNWHGNGLATLFSGMAPASLGGNFARSSSSEILVGDAVGDATPYSSLNFVADTQSGKDNAAEVMAFRANSNSFTPSAIFDPSVAFNSIFGNFNYPNPSGGGGTPEPDASIQKRISVLNGIQDDYRRLSAILGRDDKDKLDQHIAQIDDLEQRIQALASNEPSVTNECTALTQPSSSIGSNVGVNDSNLHDRIRIFCDMLYTAFACDMTRSGSIMPIVGHSSIAPTSVPGINANQAETVHNLLGHKDGVLGDVIIITNWMTSHYAYFCNRLLNTTVGDSNLLDLSSGAIIIEGGSHPHDKDGDGGMAMIVSGRAGELATMSKHVDGNGAHPCAVTLARMQAVTSNTSSPISTFGAINTPFSGILDLT